MARRLVNTTIKNQKDTFQFELWDMDSVATDLDHVVEFDVNGFEISWRGNAKDNPIMSSTMKWSMFLNEVQRSAIMPVVFSDTEFRMCVRVMQGSNVFWCGVVHAENTSEEIGDGIITVSLQASDGLGMLKNVNWVQDNGDRYDGSLKVRDAIWGVLGKLPHASLIAPTGGAVLTEHALVRPLTQQASEIFLHGPIAGQYYGVMDYMKIKADTFYYSNIEEEKVVGGTEFGSIDKYNPEEFTNAHLVLKDIMSSLGSTICFANGTFHVFDKTNQFMTAYNNNYDTFEWYVTSSNELDTYAAKAEDNYNPSLFDRNALAYASSTAYNNYPRYDFLKGAAIKAQHSVRGVTQKQTRAGSDLLYANGIGYHDSKQRPVWESGEGLTQPLIRLSRVNGTSNSVSNTGVVTGEYRGSFGSGTGVTYDGLFNTRQRDRSIVDIQIPDGDNNGQVRIHLSGNCNYTKRELSGQTSSIGTLAIYKQRVEVNNGTNWYRLSRPVRTVRYDSNGDDADINIDSSGSGRYSPKMYSLEYEWIQDTDTRYSDAWLDIPMGANSSVVESGSTSKFMQTDYPAIAEGSGLYTPPLTKLKTGTDNTLEKDLNRDVYVWRHDFVYDMPASSGTLEQLKIQQPVLEEWSSLNGPNLINASNGAALDIGTSYLDPTYRTDSYTGANDGFGNKPNGVSFFQLSGVEVMFGDGTQEFDATSVAFPTTTRGREILNLNGTRLGASFVNTGNSTFGRYTASDYITPNDYEDNLKFARPWDSTFKKESLGEMVTANMLELRAKVRKTIVCTTILAHENGTTPVSQMIMPWSKLVTDKLDSTTQMIIPYSISYTLTEGRQRIEGWIKNTSAEANVNSTTETEEDATRGPLPSLGNFEKPSGVDLSDFVHGEATDDSGGGTGTGNGGKFGDLFPIFIKRY